jgi:PhnB protein
MDLNTYLFFDGQCEDAFRLYEKVLGGTMTGLMRYADAPPGPPAFKGCNRVILRACGSATVCSDTPPEGLDPMPSGHRPEAHKTPQGFRANVTVDTPDEAERIYHALAEGGAIAMQMTETFFARRFGMLNDRFGTPWMITCLKPMPAAGDDGMKQGWTGTLEQLGAYLAPPQSRS